MSKKEKSNKNKTHESQVSTSEGNHCISGQTNSESDCEPSLRVSNSGQQLELSEELAFQLNNYWIGSSDEEYSDYETNQGFYGTHKCTLCSKTINANDFESHLSECIKKPYIEYNQDLLSEDSGECVICLEELVINDTIARLPCFCIYHKKCIDLWFDVNRSCPQHPKD